MDISEPDPGSTNGSGIPGCLAKHICASNGLLTGLLLSVMPVGKFGQPKDMTLLDPETGA